MNYINVCLSIIVFSLSGNALSSECYHSVDTDTPDHRFADSGHGIVVDRRSGLTWMRCPIGMQWNNNHCLDIPDRATWSEATTAIIALNAAGGYAGFRDWRLPTLKELNSLVEARCYKPAINGEIFPNTPNTGFWSSTEDPDHRQGAWLVYFLHGSSYMGNQEYGWAIRAVRK